MTTNYGLAGGKLDATIHIERFGTDAYNKVLQNGSTVHYRQPGGSQPKEKN